MNTLMLFCIVLLILIVLRTVKINFYSKTNQFFKFKRPIILKQISKFLIRQLRFLLTLYIGLIGIYILVERMYNYNIYPANLNGFHEIFSQIHNMNSNEFISYTYLLTVSFYISFILPYKILALYNEILKETNNKDYLQTFIVTNLNKLNSKLKERNK